MSLMCVAAMTAGHLIAADVTPEEIPPGAMDQPTGENVEGERTVTVEMADDLAPAPTATPAAETVTPVAEAETPIAEPETPLIDDVAAPTPAPAASPGAENASTAVTSSLPLEDFDYELVATPDLLTPPEVDPAASAPPDEPLPEPSRNVTINLINRLVERGVLTKEDAAELIQQAERDAEIVQQRDAVQSQAIAESNAAADALIAATPPPPDPDAVRVTYIPNIVKTQIRDEIKEDVIADAREVIYKDPSFVPDWVRKIKPFADIRVRYEGIYFPSGNDDTGVFPDFDAINTGAPFDVTGDEFSPQLNVSENRDRFRIRLRLGAEFDLGEGFTMGARLASGDSNSPVSPNQTLGRPDGNFNKYAIWFDRAFISYEIADEYDQTLALTVGRFDNPFFRVSQIMWDDDLGFDGAALQGEYALPWFGLKPFFAAGAFPIFNTSLNFPENQPNKYESYNKYLFAVQGGLDWDITRHINVTTALGYFHFENIEGVLSDPYVPLDSNDAGNTDNSRPMFAQKGNTYRPIRNIIPTEANDFGTINQFQYYGLATKFQNIQFAGQVNFTFFEPVMISIGGEYVQNLAFNRSDINAIAVNNRGDVDPDNIDDVGDFIGGNTAWIIDAEIGTPTLERRWDWKLNFGYRYVESDAVVDGFNDSDFGGGGTNLKGWTASGSLALSPNVWLTARYLSGRSIAGPQLREDIFQLDINARF